MAISTPTPYQDIYDLFFGMVTDYEFVDLISYGQDEIFHGWLLSAIGEFESCKVDLSDRDDTLEQFNQTLSDKEKKILAKLMLVEWMNPKLYTLDNLRNQLSSKDFNTFSPANLLKEIRETHNQMKKDVNRMITSYNYANFDPLKDLGTW